MQISRRAFGARAGGAAMVAGSAAGQDTAVAIGDRRELFVDRELVSSSRDIQFHLATPLDKGAVLPFNMPWEGAFCGYATVIHHQEGFRLYYRGLPEAGRDGSSEEVTCCAESEDGIEWKRPSLDFYEVNGASRTNVVLAGTPPFSHNFCPFLDTRTGVPASERFKAVAGIHRTGLVAFASADGLRWQKMREEPVLLPQGKISFDSQNVAFWSAAEQRYLAYFRTWKRIGEENFRWISRATSHDFLHWDTPQEMSFGDAVPEHLYTNQTAPYFRAPHVYLGICARFMPGRQVISDAQAAALNVDPRYYKDCSDAVLITSRGASEYKRAFPEAFLRPGLGLENWVSRSNYPALNVVQTGPGAMSFYVNRNYGQPSAYLRRYELRLDGFASIRAGYRGGELVTRPLVFKGEKLELNFSTSAAGGVRVELQDAGGSPIEGYALADSRELIGDEIGRLATWRGGESVAKLQGKPVRIRFVMKDSDVFSFRFRT